ncbi:hypothetical protein ACWGPQ_07235 [Saccharomonospora azurea]
MSTHENGRPAGGTRAATNHNSAGRLTRRRGEVTPWGELYAELLAAEQRHRGYTPEQHRANVERRVRDAAEQLDAARERNQQRRERVLRHRDLAEQLGDALRLMRPSHWNGYVPPRLLPDSDNRPAQPNTSPTRAALVAVAAEALRRESNGG